MSAFQSKTHTPIRSRRTKIRASCLALIILFLSAGLTSCGQTGPLRLPEEDKKEEAEQ